jgi:hypothetical protein
MIKVRLHFTKLWAEKGQKGDIKCFELFLLILSISWTNKAYNKALNEAFRNVMHHRDWLIETSDEFNKAVDKRVKEEVKQSKHWSKYYEKEYYKSEDKRRKMFNKFKAYERVVKDIKGNKKIRRN